MEAVRHRMWNEDDYDDEGITDCDTPHTEFFSCKKRSFDMEAVRHRMWNEDDYDDEGIADCTKLLYHICKLQKSSTNILPIFIGKTSVSFSPTLESEI